MTCFDRDKESEQLWTHFSKGRNILMLAPRRIGKTVLLNRLRQEGEAKGYRAIILDVQGFREEKAFFQQMCAVIQEELGVGASLLAAFTDKLRHVVKGADTTGGDWRQLLLSTDWREFASHLLAHLNNDKDGKPWLVLLDEIPIFALALLKTHGMDRVQDFLYTLRNFRQKYPNVRWLYTGSIGMDTIARRHSVEGALNDLVAYPLKPFDEDTAARFLANVAQENGRQMSPVAAQHIITRLGWLSPYYLEKIAHEACGQIASDKTIEQADADVAMNAMLDLDKRTYWSTWREHLDRNFSDPEQTHLFSMLAVIARSPDGFATHDTLLTVLNRGEPVGITQLRTYLDTLEADGYLIEYDHAPNCHRFRMGLLRDWWLRYVAN